MLPLVADIDTVFARREEYELAALPIVVPLAFLRRLESLGAASSLVVACVFLVLATVLMFALAPGARL
mgnify:CR=1 FL=1